MVSRQKGATPTLALGRDTSESHLVLVHLVGFAGGKQGTAIKENTFSHLPSSCHEYSLGFIWPDFYLLCFEI